MHLVKYIFLCLIFDLSNGSTNDQDFNPYEVLGLSRTASDREIRQAYKKLARYWHPDKNSQPNAHEQFTKINAAYEVNSTRDILLQTRREIFNSRFYLTRLNVRIMMNTVQHLRTIIEALIPIIFVIHMISFVRISVVIFISFMNHPMVLRNYFIHVNFSRIFCPIVTKNRTFFSVVRISVCIAVNQ